MAPVDCLEEHGRRAGNVYRHDYDDVAAKLVWDTVQSALPPLAEMSLRENLRLTGRHSTVVGYLL